MTDTSSKPSLRVEPGLFYGLYELHSGLWFIRDPREMMETGFFVGLKAYGTHVFTEFRELADHDGRWAWLKHELNGGGVESLEDARDALGRPKGPYWPPRPTALPERGMGMLLHPTNLPGSDGIGTLGDEAQKLIGWMADADLKYWPSCPFAKVARLLSVLKASLSRRKSVTGRPRQTCRRRTFNDRRPKARPKSTRAALILKPNSLEITAR